MKSKELKATTKKDAAVKLNELRKDLMKQSAQRAVGTMPKSTRQIRQTKRTIAQLMTKLNQKEVQSS